MQRMISATLRVYDVAAIPVSAAASLLIAQA
jgi:hypothetical protein